MPSSGRVLGECPEIDLGMHITLAIDKMECTVQPLQDSRGPSGFRGDSYHLCRRAVDGSGPRTWPYSGAAPPWTASSSPSSSTKTQTGESLPSFSEHKPFDVARDEVSFCASPWRMYRSRTVKHFDTNSTSFDILLKSRPAFVLLSESRAKWLTVLELRHRS